MVTFPSRCDEKRQDDLSSRSESAPKRITLIISAPCQFSCEQLDGSEEEPSGSAFNDLFEIFGEATVTAEPGKCSFHNLRLVGEDVSEILEMITAKLKVIQVTRPKKSCRCCEKMVQAPAPSRPIPGSMAGGSLLAYVLVSKFDDHLPLYRQNEIFARLGADIPRSTLADWCGRTMRILQPVIDLIGASVLGSDILHADDTPIRVLAPERHAKGIGKGVMQGRIWGYVCDQRPWAGTAPPGVVYRYAPNWKAEHVLAHLGNASGILQATPTKAMPSSTNLPQRVNLASGKRLALRIGDAIFMTSGRRKNRGSHTRRSSVSGNSTTSSARSRASLPISAGPCARN
jgi:transposase